MTKRLTLSFFATVLMILLSAAASMSTALAGPSACPTGNLSLYESPGFACTEGNLEFSNFTIAATGTGTGSSYNGSGVEVIPQTTPGDQGLEFDPAMNVFGTGSEELLVKFTVSTLNQQPLITDLGLDFNGSRTGDGHSGVTEQYCLSQVSLAGCPKYDGGQLSVTNPPARFDKEITFSGVSELAVSKDIFVNSVGCDYLDSASISDVLNSYSNVLGDSKSSVPEPGTLFACAGGLLLLWGVPKASRKVTWKREN